MINGKSLGPVCLTGLAIASLSCSNLAINSNPNIVVILADDMGWGDVNLNGNPAIETPVLNRLAAKASVLTGFTYVL